MRFLADKSLEARIVESLRAEGHDGVFVAEEARSISDTAVLELANRERRILVTNHKEFGFSKAKPTLAPFGFAARASLWN